MGGFKGMKETYRGAIFSAMVVLAAALSGCIAEPLETGEEVLLEQPAISEESNESGDESNEGSGPGFMEGTEIVEPTPLPWIDPIRSAEDEDTDPK